MTTEAQFAPPEDNPLRKATPSVDDVEARRAKAAIEGRLFSGPARRVTVGRYRVLGRIGAGGMGVVYKAHDPDLARDVAVKLMNPDAVTESDAEHARGRLVREARAMARLAHPNVIHVYDVGTVEDGVFIAMELVEGQSLGAWVASEPRPWKDVLARFLEAGRGLAAAHEAGVVHRDFKPENVLLGADGRVRVGDFGLAGGPGSETGRHEPTPSDSVRAQIERSAITEALTRTGALLGTPKYMAPEQEAGLPATARSDQFSFCVALYEALYGQAPYAGNSVVEYRLEVRDGSVRPPPPGSEVPAWIAEVLLQGLAIEPADRHPSMEALLDRLEEALVDAVELPTPRRKRPVVWFAALAMVIGFAVALGFALGQPAVEEGHEVVPISTDRAEPPTPVAERPAQPVTSAPVAAHEQAEADAPEPTPDDEEAAAVQLAPKRTTPKVGPRSRPLRGTTCYFDERNAYLREGRNGAKPFEFEGTCYHRCFKPTNRENLIAHEEIHCRHKYRCQANRTKEACAPKGSGS